MDLNSFYEKNKFYAETQSKEFIFLYEWISDLMKEGNYKKAKRINKIFEKMLSNFNKINKTKISPPKLNL